jgi:hypothetical protein
MCMCLIYVFCTIWMIEKTLVCVCADVSICVGKFGCSCHGGTSLNIEILQQESFGHIVRSIGWFMHFELEAFFFSRLYYGRG